MNAPSWDLSIAYESLSDPKISQDMKTAKEKVADFAVLDPTALGDLMKAIALKDQLTIIVRTLSSYANCLSSVDASDDGAKKLAGSVDKLFFRV